MISRRPWRRLQALLGVGTLGAAEMGEQNDLGVGPGKLQDRRRDALDARRVGDLAVLDGDVEVDAQEHALPGDVADIVEGSDEVMAKAFLSRSITPGSGSPGGTRTMEQSPSPAPDPLVDATVD